MSALKKLRADECKRIREIAQSFESYALGIGASVGVNSHGPESAARCQRGIGRALVRRDTLNKLAALWSAEGLPPNYNKIIDCIIND